jgi:hypothetical protein
MPVLAAEFRAKMLSGRSETFDDTAHEAQVTRQQLFGALENQHLLYIELQPTLKARIIQVEGCAVRQIKQRLVFDAAFGTVVDHFERIFPVMREVLIEFVILLIFDVVLVARPDGVSSN